MDKFKVILISLMAIICIFIIGFKYKKEDNDAIKFKKEYESLNETKNKNGKEYIKVNIDKINPIVYADYDKVINLIKNDTAVIYFGFPECPWCRNAVPVLLDTAKELGIEKIYYYNALSIRDKKSLDESGNIVVEEEGTKEYKELVELLYDYLPVYDGLNDETIKRLYFPTVLFVKNGKIIGLHNSTVESQKNPYDGLNKEQYEELKTIYYDYLNKTFEIFCDDAC